jgi:hypothetical protein
MLAVRRLVALALFGLLAAAFAGPAGAARPAAGYPETMSTTHFQIHYTGIGDDAVTHQQASDVAAAAEQAYATLVTGWGYPAPLNDGDARTDLWIQDLSLLGIAGYAEQDTLTPTSTGWIALEKEVAAAPEVIAHELTHLIQFGMWVPTDSWLMEGTAKWAGLAAASYNAFDGPLVGTLGAPDMSLTCTSAACGDPYEIAGYTRWEFFQYLTERYGNAIVEDIFAQGALVGTPQTGAEMLASTLVAKGTTLSAVYGDYTLAQVAGNYQVAALKGLAPLTHKTIATGTITAALPVQQVPVNHLATRYLKLVRGNGTLATCHTATLSLTVSLPAGLGSRPSLYWKALGTNPMQLSVDGNTASIAVPWDTCTGGQDGYLALPNPSLTADAQVFTVSGSLTVDFNSISSPLTPPLPIYTGPSIVVPGGELAPSIHVYGAQVIRVAAAKRIVRLIVFSSGPGKLQAAVGGAVLGNHALRAGNNDVRFRLSARAVNALKAMRTTSAARTSASLLSLTSLSTAGVKGKTITRKLTVVPTPKPRR